jgi:hypothetical protein
MNLKIGPVPLSLAEISRKNPALRAESVIEEVKRLHKTGKLTPIFDEQDGVKVCLWRRK